MNTVERELDKWWQMMPRQMKARCWGLAMLHGLVEDKITKEPVDVKRED